LIVVKCFASVVKTLQMITLSSEVPAAVRHSLIWSSRIPTCRSTGSWRISPVSGSYGGMFDTNTKPPLFTTIEIGTLRLSA